MSIIENIKRKILERKIKKDLQEITHTKAEDHMYMLDSSSIEDNSEVLLFEYVVVPEIFNIDTILSFQERMGIFKNDNVKLKQIQALATAVSYNAVFSSVNNKRLTFASCVYFLNILKEAGLVLLKLPNPCRDYFSEVGGEEIFFDGKTRNINLIIINLFNLFNQNLVDECVDKVREFQKYQERLVKASNMSC